MRLAKTKLEEQKAETVFKIQEIEETIKSLEQVFISTYLGNILEMCYFFRIKSNSRYKMTQDNFEVFSLILLEPYLHLLLTPGTFKTHEVKKTVATKLFKLCIPGHHGQAGSSGLVSGEDTAEEAEAGHRVLPRSGK